MEPELVQMHGDVGKRIAVVHAPTTGKLITAHNKGKNAMFQPRIDGVVLAAPYFAPFDAYSTVFTRRDALFALYLPVASPTGLADVWRSYIAQALFRVVGFSVAFVSPWGSASAAPDEIGDSQVYAATLEEQSARFVEFVHSWAQTALTTYPAGTPVSTAMHDLYAALATQNLVLEADVQGADAWIAQLTMAGYQFPTVPASESDRALEALVLSLPGRAPLPFAVAVAANWGNFNAVAPWRAVHASRFAEVRYHVMQPLDGRSSWCDDDPTVKCSKIAITPNQVTGGVDQAVLIDMADESDQPYVLYSHDDMHFDADVVAAQFKAGKCAMHFELHDLPDAQYFDLASWWGWARNFKDAGLTLQKAHWNEKLGLCPPGKWFYAQADFAALSVSCNATNAYLELLRESVQANMFLEIAIPTGMYCAFTEEQRSMLSLFTTWQGNDRNDVNVFWDKCKPASPNTCHPNKMTDKMHIATSVAVRDRHHAYHNEKDKAAAKGGKMLRG